MRKIFIIHSLGFTDKALEYEKEISREFTIDSPGNYLPATKCYVPGRDTKQSGTSPKEILLANRDAMKTCDEAHVLWDLSSHGTLVDIGMAIALDIPIKIVATKTHHWTKFVESRKGDYLFAQ